MITIIVTAFECPDAVKECISKILNQENFNEKFELIAACPDEPTKKVIMGFKKKYPNIIKYIHQNYECPKNQLMNNILKIVKGRILIWTDGNKFFERDTVRLLIAPFKDEKVGIVGGRIIPMNDKNNFYGFWAHILTRGIHKMRKQRFKRNNFIEHTANILAIKNGIIKNIPLDVAEGSIMSFLITHKGYKSVYIEDAKVYVNYPQTLEKSFYQRARSAKAHMELLKYTKNSSIKYTNFYNEILLCVLRDIFLDFFRYLPFILFLSYIQLRAYYSLRIRKKNYIPVWRPKSYS